MERVDIAIIGAGPAGISAALNAAIRHKSLLLFGYPGSSHKVEQSQRIENYPGLPGVTGPGLNRAMEAHLRAQGVEVQHKRITGVYRMGDYYAILADQELFEATTVILATGSDVRQALPGERELLGRGVSYCATCDGNLYRGKRIAVLCDSVELEEEVEYLCQLAGQVYYFPRFDSTLTADNLRKPDSPVKTITGARRVEGITLRTGETLPVDGVFFLKNAVAADVLLQGLATEGGSIVVNRAMETNLPGCYAAGDCTGRPYQIAKAVGEGNTAAHSAFGYLAEKSRAGR